MIKLLEDYKELIISEFDKFFEKSKVNFFDDWWFLDTFNRLYEFSISGKMLRGALIVFSEKMLKGSISNDSLKCAVAMELLQSALLIHDDIIDEDLQRRGKDTLFFQYKKFAEVKGISQSYKVGQSLGICAGNIAFSLAFSALSDIENKEILPKVISKFSHEMIIVNIGQMKDVFLSGFNNSFEEDEIFSIYRYKTSRYSFSLPFSVGAILGGASEDTIHKLEELGEYIGIIFQIQDDKIGLIYSSEKLGKPQGSDIKENKKTIFHSLIFKYANKEEQSKLLEIFGNRNISDEEINYVIKVCEKYDIFKEIDKKVMDYVNLAKEKISSLEVDKLYKDKLEEFVEYNLSRDR